MSSILPPGTINKFTGKPHPLARAIDFNSRHNGRVPKVSSDEFLSIIKTYMTKNNLTKISTTKASNISTVCKSRVLQIFRVSSDFVKVSRGHYEWVCRDFSRDVMIPNTKDPEHKPGILIHSAEPVPAPEDDGTHTIEPVIPAKSCPEPIPEPTQDPTTDTSEDKPELEFQDADTSSAGQNAYIDHLNDIQAKYADVLKLKYHLNIDLCSSTQAAILETCDSLMSFLLIKNKRYGNSALKPMQIFSKCPADTQIMTRIDDTLARIKHSDAPRKNDIAYLTGYLVLLMIQNGWTKFDDLID